MQVEHGHDAERQVGAAPIRVRALSKRYRRGFLRPWRTVLDRVDLDLGPAEIVALVGPNGSGKSTLLRILAGVEPFDGGEVRVFGAPPSARAARARVGALGDVESLPDDLRAGETLELFGAIAGLRGPDLREEVAATLARVGLADEARTTVGRFSLGMRRRLGMALATLGRPDLVLLDEPSAGLDATGHLVLRELVGAVRERGATVLFASHQLDDLTAFADRIVVVVAGEVLASGTPDELVDRTGSGRLELDGIDGERLRAAARSLADAHEGAVSAGPGRDALRRLFEAYSAGRADR